MALPKLFATKHPNLKRDTLKARAGVTRYYADFEIGSDGRRRPLLGKDLDRAKDELACLMKAARERAAAAMPKHGPYKLREVQVHHLLAQELANNTRSKYETADRMALSWFGDDAYLDVLTHDSVETWLIERDETIGPTTYNRDLKRVRQVCNWAVDKNFLVYNPLLKLRLKREQELEIIPLTKPELEAIEFEAEEWLWEMARFAMLTGLRQVEQLTLRKDQINAGVIRVDPEVAKNRKPRHVTVPDAALEILDRQYHRYPKSELVFPTENGMVWNRNNLMHRHWRPTLQAAGLPGVTWHRLRHEYVSGLVKGGVPTEVVKRLAGHESDKVMNRYLHFAPDYLREYANVLR